ncbi:hypothetical protein V6N12_038849 [Hibiscus sabdariffa]|uniref:Uncharacterized protein n=1 Tax=Hibiscus sabdariffa TaxID=183260 RepID=A0ABR2E025_9ROSI
MVVEMCRFNVMAWVAIRKEHWTRANERHTVVAKNPIFQTGQLHVVGIAREEFDEVLSWPRAWKSYRGAEGFQPESNLD